MSHISSFDDDHQGNKRIADESLFKHLFNLDLEYRKQKAKVKSMDEVGAALLHLSMGGAVIPDLKLEELQENDKERDSESRIEETQLSELLRDQFAVAAEVKAESLEKCSSPKPKKPI